MPFSLSRRIVVWRKAKRWKFSDKSRNYVFDDDWSHRGTNYHLQCSDWENTTPFQKNLIAPGCMVLENECFLHSIWLKVRTNHRNCYRRAMIVLGESRLDPPLLGKHMKFQMFKCFGRAWLARSLKDVEYEASIMSKRSRQPSRFRENQEATSESSTQDKRLLLWILLPSQKGLVILCLGLKFYWLMIYRVHFSRTKEELQKKYRAWHVRLAQYSSEGSESRFGPVLMTMIMAMVVMKILAVMMVMGVSVLLLHKRFDRGIPAFSKRVWLA